MKVVNFLNNRFEEIFLVILMSAVTIIVGMQVVTRYVLKMPLPWSEEIARYMFIWLVWIGAAYATKERKHIVIDIVSSKLKGASKKVAYILSVALWMALLVFMFYTSMKVTSRVYLSNSIATGSHMPMWIAWGSIPAGMALMLFRLIQNCIYDFKHRQTDEEESA